MLLGGKLELFYTAGRGQQRHCWWLLRLLNAKLTLQSTGQGNLQGVPMAGICSAVILTHSRLWPKASLLLGLQKAKLA